MIIAEELSPSNLQLLHCTHQVHVVYFLNGRKNRSKKTKKNMEVQAILCIWQHTQDGKGFKDFRFKDQLPKVVGVYAEPYSLPKEFTVCSSRLIQNRLQQSSNTFQVSDWKR